MKRFFATRGKNAGHFIKKLLTIIAAIAALALFTSTAAADYFRVFYYIRGEEGRERPYKFTTSADNVCQVYCELMEDAPNAVNITVNNLTKMAPDIWGQSK